MPAAVASPRLYESDSLHGSTKASPVPISRSNSNTLGKRVRSPSAEKSAKPRKSRASNETGGCPFILVTDGPTSLEDSRKIRSNAMRYHVARSKSLDAANALKDTSGGKESRTDTARTQNRALPILIERSQTAPAGTTTILLNETTSQGLPWTHPFLLTASGPVSHLNQFSSHVCASPLLPTDLSLDLQARFNRYVHHFSTINHETSGNTPAFLRCWGALMAADAVLFYAIMGFCANQISCMMYGLESATSMNTPERQDSMACKNKAMLGIRSSIDQQQPQVDNSSAIAAVAFLALSEAISLANQTTASVHVSAIIELIGVRGGGIGSLPQYALKGAIAADLKTSSLTLAAPRIPYDFGVAAHDIIQSMITHNLGSLATAFNSHSISMPTLKAIQDLRNLTIFKWYTPATVGSEPYISIGIHEKAAIEHHLLSYTALRGNDGSIDRCIHITLLLYLNTVAWLSFPALSMITYVLARHLREALQQCSKVMCQAREMVALRLWMKIIGATVAQSGEDKDWFIAGIRDCVVELDLRNVDTLMEMLGNYLIVGEIYRPVVVQVFELVRES